MSDWIGFAWLALIVFTILREMVKGETYEAKDVDVLRRDFEAFLSETRPLVRDVPKHREAALYRYTWKRATVLEKMAEQVSPPRSADRYRDFRKLARESYDRVAPRNAYGKVRLKLSPEEFRSLSQAELNRSVLSSRPARANTPYACIYLGIDSEHSRPYVGQTMDEPERRWKQHRVEATGPFKSGAAYAQWSILAQHVPLSDLNELEAYYIGLHNAFVEGHNSTQGNHREAYERGLRERLDEGDDPSE